MNYEDGKYIAYLTEKQVSVIMTALNYYIDYSKRMTDEIYEIASGALNAIADAAQ